MTFFLKEHNQPLGNVLSLLKVLEDAGDVRPFVESFAGILFQSFKSCFCQKEKNKTPASLPHIPRYQNGILKD